MRKRRSFGELLLAISALGLLGFLLWYPQMFSKGLSRGLETCLQVLIPSLFPFLVITSFAVRIRAGEIITRFFSSKKSSGLWFLFLISLTGGYPIAASIFSQLYEKGVLDRKQAESLICCATGAGPAFVVTAVGAHMFQNLQLGFLFLAAQWTASGILLLIWRLRSGRILFSFQDEKIPAGEALIQAVTSSGRSMLMICGWVLVFSGVSVLLEISNLPFFLEKLFPMLPASFWQAFLTGLMEVTNGCQAVSLLPGSGARVLCGFFMGFGGLCIGLQVHTLSRVLSLSFKKFIFWRLLQGTLAAGTTFLLLHLFPQVSPVFLSTGEVLCRTPAPSSWIGSVCLGILCLFFLKITGKSQRKTDTLNLVKDS